MTNIGIVGHEAAKFTTLGQLAARAIIRQLLAGPAAVLVSGACHLGGIDIWAEEVAAQMHRPAIILPPTRLVWAPHGFKERNLKIANTADILHCISVDRYADAYHGMRFTSCYHCGTDDHIKGGGCWTMKQARLLGKPTRLHHIANEEDHAINYRTPEPQHGSRPTS